MNVPLEGAEDEEVRYPFHSVPFRFCSRKAGAFRIEILKETAANSETNPLMARQSTETCLSEMSIPPVAARLIPG